MNTKTTIQIKEKDEQEIDVILAGDSFLVNQPPEGLCDFKKGDLIMICSFNAGYIAVSQRGASLCHQGMTAVLGEPEEIYELIIRKGYLLSCIKSVSILVEL